MLILILRIALGNNTNNASLQQIDGLKIYLHEPGKFLFFSQQDNMPNNIKVEKSMLQLSKERKDCKHAYLFYHVLGKTLLHHWLWGKLINTKDEIVLLFLPFSVKQDSKLSVRKQENVKRQKITTGVTALMKCFI